MKDYNLTIHHYSRKANIIVDALSRKSSRSLALFRTQQLN